ncbi:MAG: hypothetical protein R2932_35000 [Caldilineaceae bacterium]
MPPNSPPPDNGAISVSTCGHASSISSPMVPCPAIMAGSSNAEIQVRPSPAELFGVAFGVILRLAVADHFGAQLLHGRDFMGQHQLGDTDNSPYTHLLCNGGHAATMIAGGDGDYTARLLR